MHWYQYNGPDPARVRSRPADSRTAGHGGTTRFRQRRAARGPPPARRQSQTTYIGWRAS